MFLICHCGLNIPLFKIATLEKTLFATQVAQKWGLEQSNDGAGPGFSMAIMSETMSKEPLAAATRDNDDDLNDVVTWV